MTTRLDVAIGPVQGFVSQARRTRDLWGSSFLLAFLSAHAMRGAVQAGGCIVQPVVDGDALYAWVCGDRRGHAPRIGTVPNHFVVDVSGAAGPVAAAAEAALGEAWRTVCESVWARFVAHACPAGRGTDAIWIRQTESFWELTWTAGPGDDGARLLARRKHWRTHRPPDERGDKCTVMHDLQELSGHVGPGHGDWQNEFWTRVSKRLGSLDLKPNERLCAIALVKRLFPKKEVSVEALGWQVDASHWRSTVSIGALSWIRQVTATVPQQAQQYAQRVGRHVQDVFPERPPFSDGSANAAGAFPRLDANYLHREFVTSERRCPLSAGATQADRDELSKMLKTIYDAETEDGRRLGPPPAFYALLLADGDRMGELVHRLDGAAVSRALASFTDEVPGIVEGHDGVTVYAGGDDVLAMLPVAGALPCANALAESFRAAFPETVAENQATLSAAVVFAHVRLPLRSVLDEAHHLLDDVAKDGNGRDSLAAAVLKPGGRQCQWATTWTRKAADGARAVALIDGLVRQLESTTSTPGLSSALVYRIRELLTALCGWDRWQPGDWRDAPAGLDLRPFLHAEILHSLDVRLEQQADARSHDLTDRVYALLDRAHATGGVTGVGLDALLLARFLADRAQQEFER